MLPAALKTLATFGRMVVIGERQTQPVQFQRSHPPEPPDHRLHMYPYFGDAEVLGTPLTGLAEHVVAGRLKLHIGAILPLSQAAEAHRLIEQS